MRKLRCKQTRRVVLMQHSPALSRIPFVLALLLLAGLMLLPFVQASANPAPPAPAQGSASEASTTPEDPALQAEAPSTNSRYIVSASVSAQGAAVPTLTVKFNAPVAGWTLDPKTSVCQGQVASDGGWANAPGSCGNAVQWMNLQFGTPTTSDDGTTYEIPLLTWPYNGTPTPNNAPNNQAQLVIITLPAPYFLLPNWQSGSTSFALVQISTAYVPPVLPVGINSATYPASGSPNLVQFTYSMPMGAGATAQAEVTYVSVGGAPLHPGTSPPWVTSQISCVAEAGDSCRTWQFSVNPNTEGIPLGQIKLCPVVLPVEGGNVNPNQCASFSIKPLTSGGAGYGQGQTVVYDNHISNVLNPCDQRYQSVSNCSVIRTAGAQSAQNSITNPFDLLNQKGWNGTAIDTTCGLTVPGPADAGEQCTQPISSFTVDPNSLANIRVQTKSGVQNGVRERIDNQLISPSRLDDDQAGDGNSGRQTGVFAQTHWDNGGTGYSVGAGDGVNTVQGAPIAGADVSVTQPADLLGCTAADGAGRCDANSGRNLQTGVVVNYLQNFCRGDLPLGRQGNVLQNGSCTGLSPDAAEQVVSGYPSARGDDKGQNQMRQLPYYKFSNQSSAASVIFPKMSGAYLNSNGVAQYCAGGVASTSGCASGAATNEEVYLELDNVGTYSLSGDSRLYKMSARIRLYNVVFAPPASWAGSNNRPWIMFSNNLASGWSYNGIQNFNMDITFYSKYDPTADQNDAVSKQRAGKPLVFNNPPTTSSDLLSAPSLTFYSLNGATLQEFAGHIDSSSGSPLQDGILATPTGLVYYTSRGVYGGGHSPPDTPFDCSDGDWDYLGSPVYASCAVTFPLKSAQSASGASGGTQTVAGSYLIGTAGVPWIWNSISSVAGVPHRQDAPTKTVSQIIDCDLTAADWTAQTGLAYQNVGQMGYPDTWSGYACEGASGNYAVPGYEHRNDNDLDRLWQLRPIINPAPSSTGDSYRSAYAYTQTTAQTPNLGSTDPYSDAAYAKWMSIDRPECVDKNGNPLPGLADQTSCTSDNPENTWKSGVSLNPSDPLSAVPPNIYSLRKTLITNWLTSSLNGTPPYSYTTHSPLAIDSRYPKSANRLLLEPSDSTIPPANIVTGKSAANSDGAAFYYYVNQRMMSLGTETTAGAQNIYITDILPNGVQIDSSVFDACATSKGADNSDCLAEAPVVLWDNNGKAVGIWTGSGTPGTNSGLTEHDANGVEYNVPYLECGLPTDTTPGATMCISTVTDATQNYPSDSSGARTKLAFRLPEATLNLLSHGTVEPLVDPLSGETIPNGQEFSLRVRSSMTQAAVDYVTHNPDDLWQRDNNAEVTYDYTSAANLSAPVFSNISNRVRVAAGTPKEPTGPAMLPSFQKVGQPANVALPGAEFSLLPSDINGNLMTCREYRETYSAFEDIVFKDVVSGAQMSQFKTQCSSLDAPAGTGFLTSSGTAGGPRNAFPNAVSGVDGMLHFDRAGNSTAPGTHNQTDYAVGYLAGARTANGSDDVIPPTYYLLEEVTAPEGYAKSHDKYIVQMTTDRCTGDTAATATTYPNGCMIVRKVGEHNYLAVIMPDIKDYAYSDIAASTDFLAEGVAGAIDITNTPTYHLDLSKVIGRSAAQNGLTLPSGQRIRWDFNWPIKPPDDECFASGDTYSENLTNAGASGGGHGNCKNQTPNPDLQAQFLFEVQDPQTLQWSPYGGTYTTSPSAGDGVYYTTQDGEVHLTSDANGAQGTGGANLINALDLDPGLKYRISETQAPQGFLPMSGYMQFYFKDPATPILMMEIAGVDTELDPLLNDNDISFITGLEPYWDAAARTMRYNMRNDPDTQFNIVLHKADARAEEPLNGAKFAFYTQVALNGTSFSLTGAAAGASGCQNPNAPWTTPASDIPADFTRGNCDAHLRISGSAPDSTPVEPGLLEFLGVQPGYYYLREFSPPAGYTNQSLQYIIQVSSNPGSSRIASVDPISGQVGEWTALQDDNNIADPDQSVVTISGFNVQNVKAYNIDPVKVSTQNATPLAGAVFKLYDCGMNSNQYSASNPNPKKGDADCLAQTTPPWLKAQFVTDIDGHLYIDVNSDGKLGAADVVNGRYVALADAELLAYNTYLLREVTAPFGYTVPDSSSLNAPYFKLHYIRSQTNPTSEQLAVYKHLSTTDSSPVRLTSGNSNFTWTAQTETEPGAAAFNIFNTRQRTNLQFSKLNSVGEPLGGASFILTPLTSGAGAPSGNLPSLNIPVTENFPNGANSSGSPGTGSLPGGVPVPATPAVGAPGQIKAKSCLGTETTGACTTANGGNGTSTSAAMNRGLVVFENLADGYYYLQELSAPFGFEISSAQYLVRISSGVAANYVPNESSRIQPVTMSGGYNTAGAVMNIVRVPSLDSTNPTGLQANLSAYISSAYENMKLYNVSMHKESQVDGYTTSTPLAGAKFSLYECASSNNPDIPRSVNSGGAPVIGGWQFPNTTPLASGGTRDAGPCDGVNTDTEPVLLSDNLVTDANGNIPNPDGFAFSGRSVYKLVETSAPPMHTAAPGFYLATFVWDEADHGHAELWYYASDTDASPENITNSYTYSPPLADPTQPPHGTVPTPSLRGDYASWTDSSVTGDFGLLDAHIINNPAPPALRLTKTDQNGRRVPGAEFKMVPATIPAASNVDSDDGYATYNNEPGVLGSQQKDPNSTSGFSGTNADFKTVSALSDPVCNQTITGTTDANGILILPDNDTEHLCNQFYFLFESTAPLGFVESNNVYLIRFNRSSSELNLVWNVTNYNGGPGAGTEGKISTTASRALVGEDGTISGAARPAEGITPAQYLWDLERSQVQFVNMNFFHINPVKVQAGYGSTLDADGEPTPNTAEHPLKGAKFTLYVCVNQNLGDGTTTAQSPDNCDSPVQANTPYGSPNYASDASGILRLGGNSVALSNINLDTSKIYMLQETAPAPGFNLDEGYYTITFIKPTVLRPYGTVLIQHYEPDGTNSEVVANGQTDPVVHNQYLQVNWDIVNTLAPVHLSFRKLDTRGVPVEGAAFSLYESDPDVPTATAVSDDEGYVHFDHDLDPGDYYIAETSAPPGYIPAETPVIITVTRDYTNGVLTTTVSRTSEELQAHFVNQLFYHLDLTKTDAMHRDVPLSGAKYALYTCNSYNSTTGQCASPTVVNGMQALGTDAEGESPELNNFDFSAEGTYMLVETESPEGYKFNNGAVLGGTGDAFSNGGAPGGLADADNPDYFILRYAGQGDLAKAVAQRWTWSPTSDAYILDPGVTATASDTPSNATADTPSNATADTPSNATADTPSDVNEGTTNVILGLVPRIQTSDANGILGIKPRMTMGATPAMTMGADTPSDVILGLVPRIQTSDANGQMTSSWTPASDEHPGTLTLTAPNPQMNTNISFNKTDDTGAEVPGAVFTLTPVDYTSTSNVILGLVPRIQTSDADWILGIKPRMTMGATPAMTMGADTPSDANEGTTNATADTPSDANEGTTNVILGLVPRIQTSDADWILGIKPRMTMGATPAMTMGATPAMTMGATPAMTMGATPAMTMGATPPVQTAISTVTAPDSDAEVKFNNLPEGAYLITETAAPAGYLISQKQYLVVIKNRASASEPEVLEVREVEDGVVKDNAIPFNRTPGTPLTGTTATAQGGAATTTGSVYNADLSAQMPFVNEAVFSISAIKQYLLTNSPPIAGAEFELYECLGVPEAPMNEHDCADPADEPIYTGTSDASGYLPGLSDVTLKVSRTYKLVETKAPVSYSDPRGYWTVKATPGDPEFNLHYSQFVDGVPGPMTYNWYLNTPLALYDVQPYFEVKLTKLLDELVSHLQEGAAGGDRQFPDDTSGEVSGNTAPPTTDPDTVNGDVDVVKTPLAGVPFLLNRANPATGVALEQNNGADTDSNGEAIVEFPLVQDMDPHYSLLGAVSDSTAKCLRLSEGTPPPGIILTQKQMVLCGSFQGAPNEYGQPTLIFKRWDVEGDGPIDLANTEPDQIYTTGTPELSSVNEQEPNFGAVTQKYTLDLGPAFENTRGAKLDLNKVLSSNFNTKIAGATFGLYQCDPKWAYSDPYRDLYAKYRALGQNPEQAAASANAQKENLQTQITAQYGPDAWEEMQGRYAYGAFDCGVTPAVGDPYVEGEPRLVAAGSTDSAGKITTDTVAGLPNIGDYIMDETKAYFIQEIAAPNGYTPRISRISIAWVAKNTGTDQNPEVDATSPRVPQIYHIGNPEGTLVPNDSVFVPVIDLPADCLESTASTPEGHSCADVYSPNDTYYTDTKTAQVNSDALDEASIWYYNVQNNVSFTLGFTKTDSDGSNGLAGAHFRLDATDSSGNILTPAPSGSPWQTVSSANGEVLFNADTATDPSKDIPSGNYLLRETSAPTTYTKNNALLLVHFNVDKLCDDDLALAANAGDPCYGWDSGASWVAEASGWTQKVHYVDAQGNVIAPNLDGTPPAGAMPQPYGPQTPLTFTLNNQFARATLGNAFSVGNGNYPDSQGYQVALQKVAPADNYRPLDGAVLSVYEWLNPDNNSLTPDIDFSDPALFDKVGDFPTTSEGYSPSLQNYNFQADKAYIILETAAPNGYHALDKEKLLALTYNDTDSEPEATLYLDNLGTGTYTTTTPIGGVWDSTERIYSAKLYNYENYTFTFKKQGAVGEKGVQGAVFEICPKAVQSYNPDLPNAEAETVGCKSATSGPDGTVTFKDLTRALDDSTLDYAAEGSYWVLKETAAPAQFWPVSALSTYIVHLAQDGDSSTAAQPTCTLDCNPETASWVSKVKTDIVEDNLTPGSYTYLSTTLEDSGQTGTKQYVIDMSSADSNPEQHLDNLERYSISLQKRDQFTGLPLPGALFKLEECENANCIGGVLEPVLATFTSDAQGELIVNDTATVFDINYSEGTNINQIALPATKSFRLTETSAPNGWQITSPGYWNVGYETSPLSVIKNFEPKTVKVKKVDDANDKPLAGARFTLCASDASGHAVADTSPECLSGVVSTADGIAKFTGLHTGYYILKEPTSPMSYLPDESVHLVYLASSSHDINQAAYPNAGDANWVQQLVNAQGEEILGTQTDFTDSFVHRNIYAYSIDPVKVLPRFASVGYADSLQEDALAGVQFSLCTLTDVDATVCDDTPGNIYHQSLYSGVAGHLWTSPGQTGTKLSDIALDSEKVYMLRETDTSGANGGNSLRLPDYHFVITYQPRTPTPLVPPFGDINVQVRDNTTGALTNANADTTNVTLGLVPRIQTTDAPADTPSNVILGLVPRIQTTDAPADTPSNVILGLVPRIQTTDAPADSTTWEIVNAMYPISFQFSKWDSTTGLDISGAQFNMCPISANFSTAQALCATDTPGALTATSGEDGAVKFTGAEAGYYILRETTPAPGYEEDASAYLVKLSPNLSGEPGGDFSGFWKLKTEDGGATYAVDTANGSTSGATGLKLSTFNDDPYQLGLLPDPIVGENAGTNKWVWFNTALPAPPGLWTVNLKKVDAESNTPLPLADFTLRFCDRSLYDGALADLGVTNPNEATDQQAEQAWETVWGADGKSGLAAGSGQCSTEGKMMSDDQGELILYDSPYQGASGLKLHQIAAGFGQIVNLTEDSAPLGYEPFVYFGAVGDNLPATYPNDGDPELKIFRKSFNNPTQSVENLTLDTSTGTVYGSARANSTDYYLPDKRIVNDYTFSFNKRRFTEPFALTDPNAANPYWQLEGQTTGEKPDLVGAEFKVCKVGQYIPMWNSASEIYKLPSPSDPSPGGVFTAAGCVPQSPVYSDEQGVVTLEGLDSGYYYITEDAPPADTLPSEYRQGVLVHFEVVPAAGGGFTKWVDVQDALKADYWQLGDSNVFVHGDNYSEVAGVADNTGHYEYSAALDFDNAAEFAVNPVKRDAKTGAPLEGVQFTLYSCASPTLIADCHLPNSPSSQNPLTAAKKVQDFSTDASGEPVGLKDLGLNATHTYILVETASLPNYTGAPPIKFTKNDPPPADILNQPQLFSISFTKRDALTNLPLAGAKFTLEPVVSMEDGTFTLGDEIVPLDETTSPAPLTVQTGADGLVGFQNLPPGYYVVDELDAQGLSGVPAGYATDGLSRVYRLDYWSGSLRVREVNARATAWGVTDEPEKPVIWNAVDEDGSVTTNAAADTTTNANEGTTNVILGLVPRIQTSDADWILGIKPRMTMGADTTTNANEGTTNVILGLVPRIQTSDANGILGIKPRMTMGANTTTNANEGTTNVILGLVPRIQTSDANGILGIKPRMTMGANTPSNANEGTTNVILGLVPRIQTSDANGILGIKPRMTMGATPRMTMGATPRMTMGATPRMTMGATPAMTMTTTPSWGAAPNTAYNYPLSMSFSKVDQLGQSVPGAQFSWRAASVVGAVWIAQGPAQEVVSDEQGKVSPKSIAFGNYLIEETQARAGMRKSDQALCVKIEADSNDTSTGELRELLKASVGSFHKGNSTCGSVNVYTSSVPADVRNGVLELGDASMPEFVNDKQFTFNLQKLKYSSDGSTKLAGSDALADGVLGDMRSTWQLIDVGPIVLDERGVDINLTDESIDQALANADTSPSTDVIAEFETDAVTGSFTIPNAYASHSYILRETVPPKGFEPLPGYYLTTFEPSGQGATADGYKEIMPSSFYAPSADAKLSEMQSVGNCDDPAVTTSTHCDETKGAGLWFNNQAATLPEQNSTVSLPVPNRALPDLPFDLDFYKIDNSPEACPGHVGYIEDTPTDGTTGCNAVVGAQFGLYALGAGYTPAGVAGGGGASGGTGLTSTIFTGTLPSSVEWATDPLRFNTATFFGAVPDFTAISDAYGEVKFDGLPTGWYLLREVSAPYTYTISNTYYLLHLKPQHEIELDEDAELSSILPGVPVNPRTGVVDGVVEWGVGTADGITISSNVAGSEDPAVHNRVTYTDFADSRRYILNLFTNLITNPKASDDPDYNYSGERFDPGEQGAGPVKYTLKEAVFSFEEGADGGCPDATTVKDICTVSGVKYVTTDAASVAGGNLGWAVSDLPQSYDLADLSIKQWAQIAVMSGYCTSVDMSETDERPCHTSADEYKIEQVGRTAEDYDTALEPAKTWCEEDAGCLAMHDAKYPKELETELYAGPSLALNSVYRLDVTAWPEGYKHNLPDGAYYTVVLCDQANGYALETDMSGQGQYCKKTSYPSTTAAQGASGGVARAGAGGGVGISAGGVGISAGGVARVSGVVAGATGSVAMAPDVYYHSGPGDIAGTLVSACDSEGLPVPVDVQDGYHKGAWPTYIYDSLAWAAQTDAVNNSDTLSRAILELSVWKLPDPCTWNPALYADDPACTPPPCQWNPSVTSTDPSCVAPPCPANTALLVTDPNCTPSAPPLPPDIAATGTSPWSLVWLILLLVGLGWLGLRGLVRPEHWHKSMKMKTKYESITEV